MNDVMARLEFEVDLRGVPGSGLDRVAVSQDRHRPGTLVCVGLISTGGRVDLGALCLNAVTGFLTPAAGFDADRLVDGLAIVELHKHLRRFLRERRLLR